MITTIFVFQVDLKLILRQDFIFFLSLPPENITTPNFTSINFNSKNI